MENIYFKEKQDKYELELSNGWMVYHDEELYIQDPDEIDPKKLRGQSSSILALLSLNTKVFLSISQEGEMILWNNKGKKELAFEKTMPITGVSLISKDEFITTNSEGNVILWNLTKSDPVVTFQTKIQSFSDMELDYGYYSFINKNVGLDVYRADGTKLLTFKGQKTFFKGWRQFTNGFWLTSTSDSTIQLWSKDGEEITKLKHQLNFTNDTHYINDELFAFSSDDKVYIYKFEDGSKYSTYDNLSQELKTFIKSNNTLVQVKKDKPSILDFKHVKNPSYKNSYIPRDVIEEYNIDIKNDEKKTLWNFFNRPLFHQIQTLLQADEKSTKQFRKKIHTKKLENKKLLEEKETEIKSITKRKKIFGILALISLLATIVSALVVSKQVDFELNFQILLIFVPSATSFLFILLWNSARGNLNNTKEEEKVLHSNIDTLDILMPETVEFLKALNSYRTSIIEQIPIVRDQNLYNGTKVQEIIKNKINGSIKEMALSECGIEESDIDYIDKVTTKKAPIILDSWSYIQDKNGDSMAGNIINHNEMSLWSTKTNGTLFAVQYIQYIFLTKDKLDVFNTYYDFLTDSYISKQSFAYYYKDVTNISKREVKRVIFAENDDNYSATEITLQVSSGDSINLTIVNPDTMKKLQEQFTDTSDNEQFDNEELLKDLEEKRQQIKDDDELNQTEKNDKLEKINGNITQLQNQDIVIEEETIEMTRANQAIQNIRTRLRDHKTGSNDTQVLQDEPTNQDDDIL